MWLSGNEIINFIQNQKADLEGIKYPCKEYDYKATQKGNLIKHQKSALEAIKYPRKECDYKAMQRGHLLRHQN